MPTSFNINPSCPPTTQFKPQVVIVVWLNLQVRAKSDAVYSSGFVPTYAPYRGVGGNIALASKNLIAGSL